MGILCEKLQSKMARLHPRIHALVRFKYNLRLRCDRRSPRKDFASLRIHDVKVAHDNYIETDLNSSTRPDSAEEQWKRLTSTLRKAQDVLPNRKKMNRRKWETSDKTLDLVTERSRKWSQMSD